MRASEQELRFDGRVALITGGGRGIGRAHALALAARGAKVVVNDLGNAVAGGGAYDTSAAASVVEEIRAAGGEAVANTADVVSPEGARSIVADALEHFGGLDIVVNNAGNLAPDDVSSLTLEQLGRHLDIHVVGSLNVTQAAWPTLVEQGYGRVVLTTSLGFFGGQYLLAYSTAKGGVVSLGRSLAIAGAEHGIAVNLLAPVANTRMITDPDLRAKSNIPPLDPDAPEDPNRSPEQVTPMLVVLAHESCPVNGEIFEAGLGRFAKMFLAETPGIVELDASPETVLARWDEIVDETGYLPHASTKDAITYREAVVAAALEGR